MFVISLVITYFCSAAWAFNMFKMDHRFEYSLEEHNTRPDINVTSFAIIQPLDHFNNSTADSWGMRSFKSLDLWKPNGPVYISIEGEIKANPKSITSGLIYELAKETSGALFVTEHRFYGNCLPIDEFDLNNLKYLSAKQALADIAAVLKWIKMQKQFEMSKVVVVGGSYAGNLATWLKLLYPTLVDAVIASSAPVLAKLDFYEYLETVSDMYKKYGTEGCWDLINTKFKEYEEAFKIEQGIKTLKKRENICEYCNMSNPENQEMFFSMKVEPFQQFAQYGSVHNIIQHCKNITKNFDKFHRKYWNEKDNCLEIDKKKEVEEMQKGKTYNTYWSYQECNEFGYAKTSSSQKHPFTNYMPIESFYNSCSKIFGEKFNNESIAKAVEETNKLYQGLKPKVKNVVFVNGELDPWHKLGIIESLSEDAPAIFIPRSSHCKDLLIQTELDPPELIEARRQIKHLIKKWIGFKE